MSHGSGTKHFWVWYSEKEREYQSGNVTPFLDFDLLGIINRELADKKIWQISEADFSRIEDLMIDYSKKKK